MEKEKASLMVVMITTVLLRVPAKKKEKRSFFSRFSK